jgi:hypothetical protein
LNTPIRNPIRATSQLYPLSNVRPSDLASVAEDWGTRTFCCAEPGCNAAPTKTSAVVMVALLTILAMH